MICVSNSKQFPGLLRESLIFFPLVNFWQIDIILTSLEKSTHPLRYSEVLLTVICVYKFQIWGIKNCSTKESLI